MCMMDDSDGAVTMIEEGRFFRARLQHKCAECRRVIDAGESYHRESYVFDKKFSIHKTCAHCMVVRGWLQNCRHTMAPSGAAMFPTRNRPPGNQPAMPSRRGPQKVSPRRHRSSRWWPQAGPGKSRERTSPQVHLHNPAANQPVTPVRDIGIDLERLKRAGQRVINLRRQREHQRLKPQRGA